jgi:hypothetical protein
MFPFSKPFSVMFWKHFCHHSIHTINLILSQSFLNAITASATTSSEEDINTLRTSDANLRHLRFLHYNCERQMIQICLLTRAWFLHT